VLGVPSVTICLFIQENEVIVEFLVSLLCFSALISNSCKSGTDEEQVNFCEDHHEENDKCSTNVDNGLIGPDFEAVKLQENRQVKIQLEHIHHVNEEFNVNVVVGLDHVDS
jgi:hypothetical protein